jgi:hypothetical protein
MSTNWTTAIDTLSQQSKNYTANMPFTLYDTSVPAFIRGLQSLSHVLTVGEKYAKENGISEEDIMTARLSPDMLPFTFQVWTVSNTAKNTLVRVAGTTAIPMEDDQKTFAELQTRIAKTIEILEGVDKASFEGVDEKEVLMTINKKEKKFTGLSYMTGFALPNFYFHLTIAYAILRSKGVPIGKGDYLSGGQA